MGEGKKLRDLALREVFAVEELILAAKQVSLR